MKYLLIDGSHYKKFFTFVLSRKGNIGLLNNYEKRMKGHPANTVAMPSAPSDTSIL